MNYLEQKTKPIQIQIIEAFEREANLAGTLHGQRRIAQGQRGRRTALFPSKKCAGTIPLESRLELAHAVALEAEPAVRDFRSQALCIHLSEKQFAIPDFLVRLNSGRFEVHEIKPSIKHLKADQIERFKQIENLLEKEGVEFKLIDVNGLPSRQEVDFQLHLYSRGHSQHYTLYQKELAFEILAKAKISQLSVMHQLLVRNFLPPQLAEFLIFHKRIHLKNSVVAKLFAGHII